MRRHACLLALIPAATIRVSAIEQNDATGRWWRHVVALSGDDLQGRDHTPLDDVSQPWVPKAAAKINDFFARLVTAIANADQAPAWKPGSPLAPGAN